MKDRKWFAGVLLTAGFAVGAVLFSLFSVSGQRQDSAGTEFQHVVTDVDPMLSIAKGNVAGSVSVNQFGRNIDIGTGAAEDIWDGGDTWVAPTTARIHQIVSTDAGDDGAPVGVGARTLRVFGLTSWTTGGEVSEDIILNGMTDVPTVNAYVIIHKMRVLTKGATSSNVGVITATADTDGTVTAQINADKGHTQMLIYGVPAGKTFFVNRLTAYINKSGGAGSSADLSLLANFEPDAELLNFLEQWNGDVSSDGSSAINQVWSPPLIGVGPLLLKVRSSVSAASTDLSVQLTGVLVDD